MRINFKWIINYKNNNISYIKVKGQTIFSESSLLFLLSKGKGRERAITCPSLPS